MELYLSIIICTHNPKRQYLERVLKALQQQTLPFSLWELLLIDNASDTILASEVNLTWHPNARHIREDQLGLTPARVRGIKEAIADTLVFVDDDNILEEGYLEVALAISKNYPLIGAWGGQIFPEFEEPPPEWTKAYWWMLAIREFEQDKWSNLVHCYETIPCGAGLCVRANVANRYCELLRNNPKRISLDRKGKQLTSCGDLDLAMTACDMNMGTGQFTELKMLHLIPFSRLQEEYLLRLAKANGYSSLILESFRGKMPDLQNLPWKSRLLRSYYFWRMSPRNRRFQRAFETGKALAIQELTDL